VTSVSNGTINAFRNGSVSVSVTRALCNAGQQVVSFHPATVDETSVLLRLFLTMPSLDSSFVASVSGVNTTGGPVLIPGTALGFDGALVSSMEFVTSSNFGINCTAPAIISNQLQCTIGAGYGSTNFTVKLCNRVLSQTVRFSFNAPTISSAITANGNVIIRGNNFGPSPWDSGRSVTLTDGGGASVPCNPVLSDHTLINCTAHGLKQQMSYTIKVNIGGATVQSAYTYSTCDQGFCQNSAPCVDKNKCDCTGLAFQGDNCAQSITCPSDCLNGAECIFNGVSAACLCTDGYSGTDCSVSSSLGTGPIIGIVVGAVVFVALCIVLLVVLARRPRRYTSQNYVPVEKKDFTKIIYGEQLNETVDKNSGDLDALEKMLISEPALDTVFALNKVTAITEADKIAKALVIIFDANGKTMELLKAFTTDEVKNTGKRKREREDRREKREKRERQFL
jgi:hypothetical protein